MFPLSAQKLDFLTLLCSWHIFVRSPLHLCFAFKQMPREISSPFGLQNVQGSGGCVSGEFPVYRDKSAFSCGHDVNAKIFTIILVHWASPYVRRRMKRILFYLPSLLCISEAVTSFHLKWTFSEIPWTFNSISVHPVPSATVSAMYFSPDEIPLPQRYLHTLS